MVYRGKPSAGCENCRKAKKRCTLEQPACTRCVKLKKPCVGYRDTTQLQIQDETQSVLDKVEKKRTGQTQNESKHKVKSVWHATNFNTPPAPTAKKQPSIVIPPLATSQPRPFVGRLLDAREEQLKSLPELQALSANAYGASAYAVNFNLSNVYTLIHWAAGIPKTPKPLPDDVAINIFLNCCTADGQWSYFHESRFIQGRNSCLDLAIKACGMAALNNVRPIPSGREWSRSMYTKAIGLLNDALQDSIRSRHDDSLVAVTMLSFYENLTCDSMQSIRSWKAHIRGATQLLKLRGRGQFSTMVGRQLFRELRAQILISCIWDDVKPPEFLKDWQEELALKSSSLVFIGPTDTLMDIAFAFAELRSGMKLNHFTNEQALDICNTIDAQLVQWAVSTPQSDERWKYHELQVEDGPHVWNGMLFSYACLPIPNSWNMYRSVRILVSRTHELLARSVAKTEEEKNAKIMYFRTIRRQMTDEICATIPCLLGQAAPAFSSPCVLVTAYNSIWPIFFATTCALERLGLNLFEQEGVDGRLSRKTGFSASSFSSAAAQSAWLLGRLDYISGVVGVKWADGIANSLREAIKVHKAKALEYRATLAPGSAEEVEYLSIVGEIVRGMMGWRGSLGGTT